MKLLIVDECLVTSRGVETLRLNLVPELAKLCESVVWALPLPYGEILWERIRQRNVPNLVIENLWWPRGSIQQLQTAALRRLPRVWLLNGLAKRLLRKNVDLRTCRLAKNHGSVCCLTTFVLDQPPPACGLPLAGFVCDVNPVLPAWTRLNIVHWSLAAQAIFGISEFTCQELCHLAPDLAPKIHAIPIAAPPVSSAPASTSARQTDFYYPACAHEHKGHLVLFQACVELAHRGIDFRLVLSGRDTDKFLPGGQFDKPAVEEARRFLEEHVKELNGYITVAGNVTPGEVNALYDSTRCVVLPSCYEGFGLPLAEALQRGKEILCSDIQPFREQLAMYDAFDRAQLIPSGDAVRLADAMEQVLKRTSAPRNDFAELNRRMARWTWADVARRCYDHLCSISMPK